MSNELSRNPGQFDARSYYEAMQVDARVFVSHIQILNVSYNPVKQLLYEWRTKAMQQLIAAMGERDAGLLGAMILGDKSQLDSEVKELYQQTGVAHMLAISGLHISLLGMVLFDWLRKNGYLIKDPKRSDYNLPTQRGMEMGLFEIKETTIQHSDHISINRTPKISGRGQVYFVNLFLKAEKNQKAEG